MSKEKPAAPSGKFGLLEGIARPAQGQQDDKAANQEKGITAQQENSKPERSKSGKTGKQQNITSARQETVPTAEQQTSEEQGGGGEEYARFSNYLRADLYDRLHAYVARHKRGGTKIIGAFNQAIEEFLDRHGG